ncbi:permease for cytosine/purines, uracil, thiamine, allantoin-domain-containing protein [Fomitopsis serialis]|uniref:permease for cytosine/purines, uracil, thiamine, allantoin-domain-containing protein n=1 Tax=Fomitopsis serialis TaxID=139415 RepID=UPI0020082161|nr:permease for cytosine/purines, uracil, thiamine, allantoin-domain-containing protein [Neoantrodia serialis]KAH9925124.1 permease for cytosine/purines, uracil, thiamine, allantoin-domain-containing protein [Neoantrodia serialis]
MTNARAYLRQLLSKLEVNQVASDEDLSYAEGFLRNEDLYPVPPERRTWAMWNYVSFWITDGFNMNTWEIASSMIDAGLSWWQAWLCVWLGYGIAAPFIVLNARPGAMFHITFPVVARASFGIWGSLWCVFNRAAMACIWYGVQASLGGSCVLVMLRAIWPSIENIPNTMPASSGTTTRDFVCFFLFWLISLPAIWLPLHKVRHLFTVKAIVVPIAGVTFFVWCIVKAHGVGPIVRQQGTVHGSNLAWTMISSMMSCISNMSTLVTNAPDFASRARRPRDALWPQLIAVPLGFGIVCFLGIIVSSSSQAIYGEALWSPVDLLGTFLDNNPSHATRFAVWFISAAFIIAQVTSRTNISANSISAGCDLTALFPRFINIRRGGYIAAIVGLCMLPWNLLKSSSNFTTYLSAYSVFLSSIAGVMVTDYYLIHKGHYRVSELYYPGKDGWYSYTYGINFRAYAAYVSGIVINVVGFAGATGRPVPEAAIHIYDLSFFTGFAVSATVYYTLNRIFPAAGAAKTFQEVDHSGMIERIDSLDETDDSELEKTDDAGTEADKKELEIAASIHSA